MTQTTQEITTGIKVVTWTESTRKRGGPASHYTPTQGPNKQYFVSTHAANDHVNEIPGDWRLLNLQGLCVECHGTTELRSVVP